MLCPKHSLYRIASAKHEEPNCLHQSNKPSQALHLLQYNASTSAHLISRSSPWDFRQTWFTNLIVRRVKHLDNPNPALESLPRSLQVWSKVNHGLINLASFGQHQWPSGECMVVVRESWITCCISMHGTWAVLTTGSSSRVRPFQCKGSAGDRTEHLPHAT